MCGSWRWFIWQKFHCDQTSYKLKVVVGSDEYRFWQTGSEFNAKGIRITELPIQLDKSGFRCPLCAGRNYPETLKLHGRRQRVSCGSALRLIDFANYLSPIDRRD